ERNEASGAPPAARTRQQQRDDQQSDNRKKCERGSGLARRRTASSGFTLARAGNVPRFDVFFLAESLRGGQPCFPPLRLRAVMLIPEGSDEPDLVAAKETKSLHYKFTVSPILTASSEISSRLRAECLRECRTSPRYSKVYPVGVAPFSLWQSSPQKIR